MRLTFARKLVLVVVAILCFFFFVLVRDFGSVSGTDWVQSARDFVAMAIVTFFGAAIATIVADSFRDKPEKGDGNISPLAEEVDHTERMIDAGFFVPIYNEKDFNAQFEVALSRFEKSIHVAIVSASSYRHYLDDRVHKKWSEDPAKSSSRRRLVILPSIEQLDGLEEKDRLLEFFSQTANTMFVEPRHVLKLNRAKIFKDCAVFSNGHGEDEQLGFCSYTQRNNLLRFSKDPSMNLRMQNIGECQQIRRIFDEIWNDSECDARSKELRHLMLGEVKQIPNGSA